MSAARSTSAPLRLGALALACSLALGGCGVGLVGIIAGAAAGGGGGGSSGSPGTTVTDPGSPARLFGDGYEGSLAGFTICGSASPSIDIGAGNPGNALRPGGGAGSSGEAVTNAVFGMGRGLAIAGDLRIGSLGASNCRIWLGLRTSAACDALEQIAAGVRLDGTTQTRQFIVNGLVSFSDALTDTQWHRFLINIRADCIVEFYVDGVLIHVSTAQLGGAGLHRPVTIGGRDLGGPAGADNLLVTGTPPAGTVAYQTGFAFASLSPDFTTGSVGIAPLPSIDPSSDGQPAPSFNPGGNNLGHGEALSAATYDSAKPLELRVDLRVPAVNTADAQVWAGLEGGTVSSSVDGITDLAAGVVVNAASGVNAVQYVMYQSGSQLVVATRAHDTAWHSYRIVLRSDLHIEWYRDGLLEFTSPNPLSNSLGMLPVSLGGRSSGANARADSLAMITPGLGEALAMNQLSPTGTAPSARSGHGAIYDPATGTVLIFGGFNGTASLNDVWRLDLNAGTNGNWVPLTPTGTAPNIRDQHVQVYDNVRHRMLIFGGFDGSSLFNDVWELDLSTSNGAWTQLTPGGTAPPQLLGATGVFDSTNNRMVIFGGEDNTSILQNSVYALQFSAGSSNGSWSALSPSGTAPTAREFCAGVFDPSSSNMIIGPGDDGGSPMTAGGEFYYLRLTPLGSEAWTAISPSGPPSPPSPLAQPGLRRMSAIALWEGERRIVMFGGEDPNSSTYYPPPGTPNEVWSLNLSCAAAAPNAWFSGGPSAATPTPRRLHTLVWDSNGRRAILFGGEDATFTFLNDVWELTLP